MDSQDLYDIAAVCAGNVHPDTIVKIIDTESAGNRYAVNVNGMKKIVDITTLPQALAIIDIAEKRDKTYDVGLMQINSRNLELFGIKPEDAFEPCLNIRLGSVIIGEFYKAALKTTQDPQEALQKALSGYNTGNFDKGFENGYVKKYYSEADIPEKPDAQSAVKPQPDWENSGRLESDLAPNTGQQGSWNQFLDTSQSGGTE